jgi:hypothetical protein
MSNINKYVEFIAEQAGNLQEQATGIERHVGDMINKVGRQRGHHDDEVEWTSKDDHKTTAKAFRQHLKTSGHGNIRGESSGNPNLHFVAATPPNDSPRLAHTLETTKAKDGTYTHSLYTSVQANHH